MEKKVKQRTKKLPKLAYLIYDDQGEEDFYLIAGETMEGHASSQGAKVVVGTYKLISEDVVQLVTKISKRAVRQRR